MENLEEFESALKKIYSRIEICNSLLIPFNIKQMTFAEVLERESEYLSYLEDIVHPLSEISGTVYERPIFANDKDINTIKRKIKYARNPLEKKNLERLLAEKYKEKRTWQKQRFMKSL